MFLYPLDLLARLHVEILEIDIVGVFARDVDQPVLDRDFEHVALQVHRLGPEDPGIHELRGGLHDGLKIHQGEDVSFEVDTGSDLGQLHTILCQGENAALRYVEHGLSSLGGVLAAEGNLLDLLDELSLTALLFDLELAVRHSNLETAGGEGPHENDSFRVLTDVDESAGPHEAGTEFAHVDIAILVHFRCSQEGDVEAAPVVEIKLVRLIEKSVDVRAGAEVESAVGHPADHARLRRQGQEIEDAFLVGHPGRTLGHADAEIHDLVGPQLEGRPACDHLPFTQLQRRDGGHGNAHLPREARVVLLGEGHPVVFRPGNDHAVHEDAGDLDVLRVQGVLVGDPLDLGDDEAVVVFGRHGLGQHLDGEGLPLHGDVAVCVRRCTPYDGHVDGGQLVEENLLSFDLHELNEVFTLLLCFLVQFSAVDPGVDEGPQADVRYKPRLAGGKVAE